MSLFNSVDFVRRRYASPVRTKGRITNGVSSDLPFSGSFQPSKGDSTSLLPEHERREGQYDVRTSTELRAVSERLDLPADEVIVGTAVYKVLVVGPWQNGLINHYMATVELVGQS